MRYVWAVPRKQKLKVYRRPAGFYDAYVAAPSQQAALEAWGSDRNLFTRGIAEQITDEGLMREPLNNPGQIVRRSRGTAAEQLAALPPAESKRTPPIAAPAAPEPVSPRVASPRAAKLSLEKRKAKPKSPPKLNPKAPPKRRPDKAARDAARAAFEVAEKQYRNDRAALKRRADQLAKEEAALDRAERTRLARLTREREKAEAAYDRQMRVMERLRR